MSDHYRLEGTPRLAIRSRPTDLGRERDREIEQEKEKDRDEETERQTEKDEARASTSVLSSGLCVIRQFLLADIGHRRQTNQTCLFSLRHYKTPRLQRLEPAEVR